MTLVMAPLFFLMPTLGKITDMNHSTIQASRYMAWERTVADRQAKSTSTLKNELHNRFFINSQHGIHSNETGVITDSRQQNPFWSSYRRTVSGEKTALFASRESGTMRVSEGQADLGNAGVLSKAIGDVGSKLGGALPDAKWDLASTGLYKGAISVSVANAGMFTSTGRDCDGTESDSTFVCIHRHNAIMVDGWSAFSRSDVEQRSRAFVPGAALRPIGELVSTIGAIPLMKEVKGLEDAFGKVDVDVLPLDRYQVQ